MRMASYGPDGQQQGVVEKWKSRPKKVRGIPTFPPPRRRLRVLSPIPQANLQFSPSFLTHTFQSRQGDTMWVGSTKPFANLTRPRPRTKLLPEVFYSMFAQGPNPGRGS